MITGSAWKIEAQAAVGGVGSILTKKAYQSAMEITCISPSVLRVSFNGNPRLTVLSVYRPTEVPDTEAAETFHDDVQCTVAQTPTHDILFVVGDFNAHLSKTKHKDIGWYYHQRMNRNGELLHDTMQEANLEATNIHFEKKRVERCGPIFQMPLPQKCRLISSWWIRNGKIVSKIWRHIVSSAAR